MINHEKRTMLIPLALPTVILAEFFVLPPVIVVDVDGVGLLSEPSRSAADPDPDMLKIVKPGPAPRNVLYRAQRCLTNRKRPRRKQHHLIRWARSQCRVNSRRPCSWEAELYRSSNQRRTSGNCPDTTRSDGLRGCLQQRLIGPEHR